MLLLLENLNLTLWASLPQLATLVMLLLVGRTNRADTDRLKRRPKAGDLVPAPVLIRSVEPNGKNTLPNPFVGLLHLIVGSLQIPNEPAVVLQDVKPPRSLHLQQLLTARSSFPMLRRVLPFGRASKLKRQVRDLEAQGQWLRSLDLRAFVVTRGQLLLDSTSEIQSAGVLSLS